MTEWARRHFTLDNAVMWIVGDGVPDGLRLDLPRGAPTPLPAVTSALPRTPAWFGAQGEALALHALVRRSTAAMLYCRILGKALFADLRQRGGYSYTAQADYQVLDNNLAAVVAVADSAPGKEEAVVGGLVDVLARLRVGTIAAAELESAKAAMRDDLDDVELAQLVPGYALDALIGRRSTSPDDLRAEIEATTVDDIHRVAAEVHDAALVQVPTLGLTWASIPQAPAWSDSPVWGREFAPLDPDGGTLVVGPEGVSLRVGENVVTVRYTDCVAVQAFPDGGRRLYGRDGFSVPVEPTLHRLDPGVTTAIVDAVGQSLVIPMPPRSPEQVPQPSLAPEQPRTARPRAQSGSSSAVRLGLRRAAYMLMWPVSAFFLLLAIAATRLYLDRDPEMPLGGAIFMWALFAVPAFATWRLRLPRSQLALTPR